MLIFIGNFFILNLTLAVIIVKFNESHENKKGIKQEIRHRLDCECQLGLNFSKMSRCGYFPQLKLNSKEKHKLENKIIQKRQNESLIKVDKNFRFKYKAKKSESSKKKIFSSQNVKSKNLNEFVKGMRFQEDTHFQKNEKVDTITKSINLSVWGKQSHILNSNQQSMLFESGSKIKNKITKRFKTCINIRF